MAEAEELESYGFPVRYISIGFSNHEDGGGLKVEVRLDGVEPEKVLEVSMKLIGMVRGKENENDDMREVV